MKMITPTPNQRSTRTAPPTRTRTRTWTHTHTHIYTHTYTHIWNSLESNTAPSSSQNSRSVKFIASSQNSVTTHNLITMQISSYAFCQRCRRTGARLTAGKNKHWQFIVIRENIITKWWETFCLELWSLARNLNAVRHSSVRKHSTNYMINSVDKIIHVEGGGVINYSSEAPSQCAQIWNYIVEHGDKFCYVCFLWGLSPLSECTLLSPHSKTCGKHKSKQTDYYKKRYRDVVGTPSRCRTCTAMSMKTLVLKNKQIITRNDTGMLLELPLGVEHVQQCPRKHLF